MQLRMGEAAVEQDKSNPVPQTLRMRQQEALVGQPMLMALMRLHLGLLVPMASAELEAVEAVEEALKLLLVQLEVMALLDRMEALAKL